MNYAQIPQAAPQLLAMLKTEMEQYLAQNPVTRGQSPGERAPASLAALLDATSARQSNPFMASRVAALREAGLLVLRIFREHVKEKYKVSLDSGAAPAGLRWNSLSPADIEGIDHVDVQIENDSFAVRLQKAEMLANVPDPQQRREVMEVAETGRLDSVVLATEEDYALVRSENESILRGEDVLTHPSDDNYFHVQQHALNMKDPSARTDTKILAADARHFNRHYSQAFGVPLADVGKTQPTQAPMLGPNGQPVLGPDGQPVMQTLPPPDPNYRTNCQILRGQPVTPPNATMPMPAPGAQTATHPPAPGGASATKPPAEPGQPNASEMPSLPHRTRSVCPRDRPRRAHRVRRHVRPCRCPGRHDRDRAAHATRARRGSEACGG